MNNNKFVDLVVELPVTQLVRVESSKPEQSSVEDYASFLLSQWVEATCRKRMRLQLKTKNAERSSGFSAAVLELGTHRIHGHNVPYSRNSVYNILRGKTHTVRLLRRIIAYRPDLLMLPEVSEETKARARKMGWSEELAEKSSTLRRQYSGFQAEQGSSIEVEE